MTTINSVPINRDVFLSLIPDSIIGVLLRDFPEERQFELPRLTSKEIVCLSQFLERKEYSPSLSVDTLKYLSCDLLDVIRTNSDIVSHMFLDSEWIETHAQYLANRAVKNKDLPLFRSVITRCRIDIRPISSDLGLWKLYEPIELALTYGGNLRSWQVENMIKYHISWRSTPDYCRYYYLLRDLGYPIPEDLYGRIIQENNIEMMKDMSTLPSFQNHDEKTIDIVIREASYIEDVGVIRKIFEMFGITSSEIIREKFWFCGPTMHKWGMPLVVEALSDVNINLTSLKVDDDLFRSLFEAGAYSVLHRIMRECEVPGKLTLRPSDNYGQLFTKCVLPLLVSPRGYAWLDLLMDTSIYSSYYSSPFDRIRQLIVQPGFPIKRYNEFFLEKIDFILCRKIGLDIIDVLDQHGYIRPFSLEDQDIGVITYLLENGLIDKDTNWYVESAIIQNIIQKRYEIASLLSKETGLI